MKKLFLLVIPLIALASFVIYDNQAKARSGQRIEESDIATEPVLDDVLMDDESDAEEIEVNDESADSLKKEIEDKKDTIRDLILSKEEAPGIIDEIEKHQDEIAQIEKKAGITTVQQKIANLRHKSCLLQQEDPKLIVHRKQIEMISKKIRQATAPEQAQVKKLMERAKNLSSDDADGQVVEQKMKKLHERAQEKTKKLRQLLDQANQKLQSLMMPQIDAVRPLAQELKKRQDRVRTEVKPHYEELKKELKKLAELASDDQEIVKERIELKQLRTQLNKIEPCVVKSNSMQQAWEELVI